jgi:hypothetical protein
LTSKQSSTNGCNPIGDEAFALTEQSSTDLGCNPIGDGTFALQQAIKHKSMQSDPIGDKAFATIKHRSRMDAIRSETELLLSSEQSSTDLGWMQSDRRRSFCSPASNQAPISDAIQSETELLLFGEQWSTPTGSEPISQSDKR